MVGFERSGWVGLGRCKMPLAKRGPLSESMGADRGKAECWVCSLPSSLPLSLPLRGALFQHLCVAAFQTTAALLRRGAMPPPTFNIPKRDVQLCPGLLRTGATLRQLLHPCAVLFLFTDIPLLCGRSTPPRGSSLFATEYYFEKRQFVGVILTLKCIVSMLNSVKI